MRLHTVKIDRCASPKYVRCGTFVTLYIPRKRSVPSPMDRVSPHAKVTVSGVYKVFHADDHVPAHYVTILYGDIFPN